MEEKDLTTLLRSPDLENSRRTWRCPGEHQLAAYVNGQYRDRQKLEKHLADCKACLETIALLVNEVEKEELVPPGVLARARGLADRPRVVGWNWGWTLATAASACLLIVASVVLWQLRSAQTPIPSHDLVAQSNEPLPPIKELPSNSEAPSPSHPERPRVKESLVPTVRGNDAGTKLTMIFPREGSTVRVPLPALRWLPVSDATFYEVKIVTEDGAVVVTETTNDTTFQTTPDTLKIGSKYFVTVVAHLNGNRTIKSEPVKFRVAEAR